MISCHNYRNLSPCLSWCPRSHAQCHEVAAPPPRRTFWPGRQRLLGLASFRRTYPQSKLSIFKADSRLFEQKKPCFIAIMQSKISKFTVRWHFKLIGRAKEPNNKPTAENGQLWRTRIRPFKRILLGATSTQLWKIDLICYYY